MIRYEVVEANLPWLEAEYVARSIDRPLQKFPDVVYEPTAVNLIGLLGQGDVVQERRWFASGQHYIIIGSWAFAPGYYMKFKITISTETGQKIKEVTTDKVNEEQYFVVGFGVNADDPNIDGPISPGESPPITPSESEKPEPGWPIDPKMFEDMMNFMVQAMMMMAMMQAMVGMMGGMAQAFTAAW